MKKGNISNIIRGGRSRLWKIGTLIGMGFLALVLVLGFLTGCPAEQDNGPMTITDQAGRTVTIAAEPQRIVSIAPSNTELVYALGLEDRLFGVTTFDEYPEAAKDKPKVGSFSSPEPETIVSMEPDLILAANLHVADIVPQLEALGLTVVVISPGTLDEVLEAITLLGLITGAVDKAAEVMGDMESRIKAITDITATLTEAEKPRVFISIFPGLYSAGSDSLINELIVKAGGINVAGELTGFPVMSLEAIIDANPEVMLASVGHGTGDDDTLQELLDEARLAGVDARLDGRVYGIIGDLINKGTPRIIEGLEQMARLLHPELFP